MSHSGITTNRHQVAYLMCQVLAQEECVVLVVLLLLLLLGAASSLVDVCLSGVVVAAAAVSRRPFLDSRRGQTKAGGLAL